MLLDQETLRFIFGLKLRNFRQQKALSLMELSKRTRLSPSYLNEIEKGKKYPKNDKIILLAQSLEVAYDDLVSIKLSKELGLLSELFEKNVLQGLPLHIFGIPGQTLFELFAERPQQAGALFGMILEIVRNYQLSIEEIFFAILRAYLDMNSNYFPEIEEKAEIVRAQYGLVGKNLSVERLKEILESEFDYIVEEKDFIESLEIGGLFSIYSPGHPEINRPCLFLNRKIDDKERLFILLRELGFCSMNLKERSVAGSVQFDSFDQVFNNFKASYFASAVLFPEESFLKEIHRFFSKPKWDKERFLSWALDQVGTVESFFYRLSQLLPKHLGMEELFYLRFKYNQQKNVFEFSRELHLSSLHGPHKARDTEHYCRRWLTISLLEEAQKKAPKAKFTSVSKTGCLVGAQRSHFWGTESEYLCLSIVKPNPTKEGSFVAHTLGLHLNKKTKKQLSFCDDDRIVIRPVGDTCERCGILDCKERVAPPLIIENKLQLEKTQLSVNAVLTKWVAQSHLV